MTLTIQSKDVFLFNSLCNDISRGKIEFNRDFFFDCENDIKIPNKFFYLSAILLEYHFKNGTIKKQNGIYSTKFPKNLENINLFFIYPRNYTVELKDQMEKNIPNLLKCFLMKKSKFIL